MHTMTIERNEHKLPVGKLAWGLVLLTLGVVLFLETVDLWDSGPIWTWWPLFLIFLGTAGEIDALRDRKSDGSGRAGHAVLRARSASGSRATALPTLKNGRSSCSMISIRSPSGVTSMRTWSRRAWKPPSSMSFFTWSAACCSAAPKTCAGALGA